jgi:hypothetical protein
MEKGIPIFAERIQKKERKGSFFSIIEIEKKFAS